MRCADVVAAPLFAQGSGSFAATLGFGLDFVGDGDDFHFVFVFAVKFQFVDHGVEAVIVGTQGVQHLPDDAVVFVFVEGVGRVESGGDDDGQDDVAPFFVFGETHDAANGLHHVYLRVARGEEEHGIQCGHVHAFREAAHVGEDAAGVFCGFFFQPLQARFFFDGIHAAVHVSGVAQHGELRRQAQSGVVPLPFFFFCRLVGFNDFLKAVGNEARADFVFFAFVVFFDDLAEGDCAAHRFVQRTFFAAQAVFGQGFPAADDFGGVIYFEFVVTIGEQVLQAAVDVRFFDGKDDDFVINE